MGMKTSLTLGSLAVAALLVAGIAYWEFHESSHTAALSGTTGAIPAAPHASTPPPAPAPQASAPPPAPAPQASTPPSASAPEGSAPPPAPSLQASAPPPAPAPALRPSSTPPVSAQSNEPAASPATPPSPPATAERVQATKPPSATPSASTATLPAEGQMSESDRRQVQQLLQRLDYYQGPVDGKFGRSTRAAIRRFQASIGVKSAGYLTAAEATRLKGSVPR